MKIVYCCESNKQISQACVSRINQHEAVKTSRKNCRLPGGALKNAGVKNVGEGVQGKKMPVGKKCPPKTVTLAVDEKAQSRWRPSRA